MFKFCEVCYAFWYFSTARVENYFVMSLLIYRDGEVAFDMNERTADKIVEFMKE